VTTNCEQLTLQLSLPLSIHIGYTCIFIFIIFSTRKGMLMHSISHTHTLDPTTTAIDTQHMLNCWVFFSSFFWVSMSKLEQVCS
jgi:hypothetical protein